MNYNTKFGNGYFLIAVYLTISWKEQYGESKTNKFTKRLFNYYLKNKRLATAPIDLPHKINFL